MPSTESISPKLSQAPAKPVLDAAAYAADIRARRGDVRVMESGLGLNAEAPEGWEWRWCNDVGDNIPNKLADGWRFVDPAVVNMSRSVGKGNDSVAERVEKITTLGGAPIKTVLMEIPKELADEYRDIRSLSQVRRFEETVQRGAPIGISGDKVYTNGNTPGSLSAGIENTIGRKAA